METYRSYMRLKNRTIYTAAQMLRRWGVSFHETSDLRVQKMQREIRAVGGTIEFAIEQFPDGSWTAESKNIDGIITGGLTTRDMASLIKDAVFTYFGIPPHLCTDALLRAGDEPITSTQRVYV
ncbi:MAG: hypothetical protein A2848_00205 [Candidatus Magasanikbacteria bacterium RIFCSPHIGHO2_01_FULL_50_8]|uniref:Uncharacterized protein n=2 Tax=Candidatus Magasanikiibacteriota TaxID=1752731 RepID=A0A1F6LMY4_9BACT|nr:MAG: hypothetical protein A2848_00205 [Candidatus Magasanikbacteria bacterium RIFCSPHIGHO2_01_FULL_50_8]